MSMVDSYYGDFGMAEASARKRRAASSIANIQSATLGQKRGQRDLKKLMEQLTEGFHPKMAEYGARGLAGPNVASGIQRKGLERYATQFQEQIGEANQALQDAANQTALDEAASQADLEDYINQLRLQKQQSILDAATALRQYSSY